MFIAGKENIPLTLTDYATLKKWECLDPDSGEALAEEVRKYHIPDFSNWKNHDVFDPPTFRFGATGLHPAGDDVRSL